MLSLQHTSTAQHRLPRAPLARGATPQVPRTQQQQRWRHPRDRTCARAGGGDRGPFRDPLHVLADQLEDPVLKAAIKEPLAFWGGMFAGALGLNLQEEPLRSWIDRTSNVDKPRDAPQLPNGAAAQQTPGRAPTDAP